MILTGEHRSTWKEISPSATSSITVPSPNPLNRQKSKSNPGVRDRGVTILGIRTNLRVECAL